LRGLLTCFVPFPTGALGRNKLEAEGGGADIGWGTTVVLSSRGLAGFGSGACAVMAWKRILHELVWASDRGERCIVNKQ